MPDYRLHFLDAKGRRQRTEAIRATDDGAAMDRARIRHDAYSVEIVCGARMVGTIPPSGG
jgi:hypothetical protein